MDPPPQPPPPPPPGKEAPDGMPYGGAPGGFDGPPGYGGNGGYYPPPEGYGYPPPGGYPAGYPPANYPPGYGGYGYDGKGAPPPPPHAGQGAPNYGPGFHDMYGGGYPPPSYGGSYGSFDGKGHERRDVRDERDGRGSYDGKGRRERSRDFDRRDGRRDDREDDRRRDYDRGGRREGKGGFEGFGRGVPLPEPVELQLKGLPMDASEPALRSLFNSKGLQFDSVQFTMSAIVKVSGHALADQVISTFHNLPVAGRPIECFRLEEASRSRPRSRRRERSHSPPRRERSPPPRERRERSQRSRTPPRGGGRERSRSRRRNDWGDKGGGRGGGGGFRDDGGRSRGAILKYDEEKGFGFIKPDRGSEDIFVHFSSLPRDYQRGGNSVLQPGDRVTYDHEIDQKKGKPCAKNVQMEGGAGGGGASYGQRGGWGGGSGGGGGGRSQGSVSNWDGEKGFGFIAPDGSDKDLFVHFSSLPRSYQRGGDCTLQAGDRVSFDIEFDDRKGKNCAKNVHVNMQYGGELIGGIACLSLQRSGTTEGKD